MKPFDEVVTRHGPTVLRVCRAVLGPADAEDAWSETFLAALRAYPELPEDANVEAWLVTIAHRKAVDAVRATARRPVVVDRLPEAAVEPELPEEDGELWAALRQLPIAQRRAVAYHHLGGLPHKEVAALLGTSPDAVRRAASDGIRKLRETYPRAAEGGSP